jgi:hypothetical protein
MTTILAAIFQEKAIAVVPSVHSWVVFDSQQGMVQSLNDVIATVEDQPSPKEA